MGAFCRSTRLSRAGPSSQHNNAGSTTANFIISHNLGAMGAMLGFHIPQDAVGPIGSQQLCLQHTIGPGEATADPVTLKIDLNYLQECPSAYRGEIRRERQVRHPTS